MKKRTAIWRGVKGECPKCAQAPLFRSYLKPVLHCTHCAYEWENVRADDGPAWATILIVGHLLAPFFHLFIFQEKFPQWMAITAICSIATILSLALLPRVKGGFMGLLWITKAPTSHSDINSTYNPPKH